MEQGNYHLLSWMGGASLTFSLLLGNDGWLLWKRLADWRIGGWVGCCSDGEWNGGGGGLHSKFHTCFQFHKTTLSCTKLAHWWTNRPAPLPNTRWQPPLQCRNNAVAIKGAGEQGFGERREAAVSHNQSHLL